MKSEEEGILRKQLSHLPAKDLKYLCQFFKLSRGGSKKDMIKRILKSGNEYKEIAFITGYVRLMNDIEDELNKKYFKKILIKSKIPYSGNKHTLALRVVENFLISPYELLNKLTLATLRDLYYNLYGKITTKPKGKIIPEILASYRLEKEEEKMDKVKASIKKKEKEVAEGKFAFVLMPFRKKYAIVYTDVIKPAVENQNYICKRADDFFTPNKIMDDIERAIRDAAFIIADLTGKNPNVFYEVGMSHILKKKVILLAQSLDDVPFDLLHWRHIRYNTSKEGLIGLRRKLEKTIKTIS
ncbi:MAG: hypothetical protein JSV56_04190 [Methanomassiliicoccales archaeon]|nr:MAG: hypothetical protein JSV56_04190 [Methanomassiliicoccales archaeon]